MTTRPTTSTRSPCRARRRLLGRLGAAGGLLVVAGPGALTGCNEAPRDPGTLVVDAAALPSGGRMVVTFRDQPVELSRDGETIVARSLLCTHFSCEVRWSEEERVYVCPCHRGRFDADGRVIDGPAPRPLDEFPATLDGDRIVVGSGHP